jgi:hypothetical protein
MLHCNPVPRPSPHTSTSPCVIACTYLVAVQTVLHMLPLIHIKCLLLLSHFNAKWNVLTDVSTNIHLFYDSPPSGKLDVSCGRTDTMPVVADFRCCFGTSLKDIRSYSVTTKSEEVLILAGGAVQVGYWANMLNPLQLLVSVGIDYRKRGNKCLMKPS